MGSQDCKGNPAEILETAIKSGITIFQYREKGNSSLTRHAKIELGKELRAICRYYSIPFIINDDVELIDVFDADGIHVGQDDYSVKELRKIYPNKIMGLSVSTPEELAQSPIELVDYIGAGPIFPTASKADAKAVVGLEWIKTLRAIFPELPIAGIGGITVENAQKVLSAGADGVCFISAVTQAKRIEEAVKKL